MAIWCGRSRNRCRLSKTYWIICPKATASLPKIVTFRDWLLAEASSDLRRLQKKGSAVEIRFPGAIAFLTRACDEWFRRRDCYAVVCWVRSAV